MSKIFIIEGPDGTGKSTLAKRILNETGGHLLHSSFNKDWDMEAYHEDIMLAAIDLSEYQPVVIDRWSPSEFVYGTVFRGGPSYETDKLIEKFSSDNIVWIYCRNDNAVQNHFSNSKKRKEMFSDIQQVVKEFDKYVEYTKNNWIHIPWREFNFDNIKTDWFIKELLK